MYRSAVQKKSWKKPRRFYCIIHNYIYLIEVIWSWSVKAARVCRVLWTVQISHIWAKPAILSRITLNESNFDCWVWAGLLSITTTMYVWPHWLSRVPAKCLNWGGRKNWRWNKNKNKKRQNSWQQGKHANGYILTAASSYSTETKLYLGRVLLSALRQLEGELIISPLPKSTHGQTCYRDADEKRPKSYRRQTTNNRKADDKLNRNELADGRQQSMKLSVTVDTESYDWKQRQNYLPTLVDMVTEYYLPPFNMYPILTLRPTGWMPRFDFSRFHLSPAGFLFPIPERAPTPV